MHPNTEILDTLTTIRNETRPIDGHPDPLALNDCWNSLHEQIQEILAQRPTWISITQEVPPTRNNAYIVRYGSHGAYGTLHVDYFTRYDVTHWLYQPQEHNQ